MLCLLICTACAKAPESPRPRIPSIQCVARGLGAAGLEAEWQAFADHIDACVVVDPEGTPALEILAVSAQRFYSTRPLGSATVAMPLPAILLPGGRLVGRLPYHYPGDPPRTTTLELSQWQAGIPQRIEMRMREPLTGDHEVVMLLDAASGTYGVAAPDDAVTRNAR